MENFIQINGQRIVLTEGQTAAIERACANDSGEPPAYTIGDIPAGELCKIDEFELIVLEHLPEGTAVLLKDLLHKEESFGENNDYRNSNVDNICDSFKELLEETIGREGLIEHEVDLTSDDGLKDYGTIMRKASLLTAEQYRRYVEILDKYKLDKWWWLATPFSTATHEDTDCVKCVSPRGFLDFVIYGCHGGVRPFCILKSDILVSK